MTIVSRWMLILLLLSFNACSLPPEKPITIDELMGTKLFRIYKIEESPEDILRVLNRDGEAIVPGERKAGRKLIPVWVKILATSGEIDVSYYER